jgi:hypothetical protein
MEFMPVSVVPIYLNFSTFSKELLVIFVSWITIQFDDTWGHVGSFLHVYF